MVFTKSAHLLSVVLWGILFSPALALAESSVHHGNNQRSGYTDASVPRTPDLLWTYTERHPPRPAWKEPNRELQYIDFDYATQVTVSDGLMIFGSSADHAVRAVDLASGEQRWHFYTEGPARFAPAVDSGRAYVASDDGYLYALDAGDGSLLWKFRGGPSNGKLLGNEQMISHWPLRSGVLVEAGKIYLTAGMWSRDGVFIYCLDAADGSVIRVSISELLEAYAQYWKDGKKLKEDVNVLPHGQDYAWSEPKVPPFPLWMSPLPYSKWEADVGYVFTLLQAGNTVLAGGRDRVSGIDFASGEILWQHNIEGDARSICAADGHIVVSSTSGKIYVFGRKGQGNPKAVVHQPEMPVTTAESTALAKEVVDTAEIRSGYALVLGAGNGQLLCELARQTELTIYCLEPDAERADTVREMLDRAGLLGLRVSVHAGGFEQLPYNPYWANLLVWGDCLGSSTGKMNGAELYRVLRPYGGLAVQLRGAKSAAATRAWLAANGIPEEEMTDSLIGLLVTRGVLPGAGQWTHAYANIGRTGSSEDALARLPLGMLWWGGPGPARIFTRHSRAPVPIFSHGNLFIQGQHDVFAVDAYNGREMWNRHLENVARVPAANRGGNIVADKDSVYCIQGTKCLRLDARTGATRAVYEFPLAAEHRAVLTEAAAAYADSAKTRIVWEYLGVTGDFILGSLANEVLYETMPSQPYFSAAQQARYLFAFRKSSGRLAWHRKVDRAVSPLAIVANEERVYYLDRTDERLYQQTRRRGDTSGVCVLKVVDLATGRLLWERPGIRIEHKALILKDDVLVTYPNPIEHDVQEGDSGVAAYSALDGTLLWEKAEYAGVSGNGRKAIIRHTFVIGDTLFLPWAFDLRTGEEKLLHRNPLTGREERFDVKGQNFCGTMAAGKSLVAYRSASIGFQEVGRDSGSFWLPELRPSCWISLLPAGGLVLSPEGSASCLCPYTYKTSAAFMPVERFEDWGVYLSGNKQALAEFKREKSGERLPPAFNKLYINLNAPGDRMDARAQVWMAYPRPMARLTTPRYLDTPLPMVIRGVSTGSTARRVF